MQVSDCVHALTGVIRASGEQHTVTTKGGKVRSRMKTDAKDLADVTEYLRVHSPFAVPELDDEFEEASATPLKRPVVNIHTTKTAPQGCNVAVAESRGQACLDAMAGALASAYSYARTTYCSVTQRVKKAGKRVTRDFPDINALFQRFYIASQADASIDPDELFQYELAASPPSMFDDDGLPLKPNKPELVSALLETLPAQRLPYINKSAVHVLDGGCLLWKVKYAWRKTATYGNIARECLEHVRNRYGTNTQVVFDGYEASANNTKNLTQIMRKGATPGAPVETVADDTVFDSTKTQQRPEQGQVPEATPEGAGRGRRRVQAS